jgi:CHAD domain-containing protein
MSTLHEALIESLQAQVSPIEPQDTMAEAGRKALLNEFVKMLHHEAGSRAGEDPEEVHDMRVAIRRMRSTLGLLADYYKTKAITPYLKDMRKIARALGAVRDLDVMIADIQRYGETRAPEMGSALQPICDALDQQRIEARKELIRLLDKGSYRRFVEDFAGFVTKTGKGARAVETDEIHPFRVRHLLPRLIYEHLAAVRAYDGAVADADPLTLHALRIEFKRLRYVVSIFTDVLGGSINDYIDELKAIQDHLGGIADIRAAKDRLSDLTDALAPEEHDVLRQYVEHLDEAQDSLRDSFLDVWKHFNTKTVQRQLANAVASL